MYKNKNAFTIVELIVVVTIISILWAIWFWAYSSNIADSRDSQRKSDLAQVESALKIYKQKRWYYPIPWDNFNITYSWTTVAYEWRLNENTHINTLEKLPLDPKIKQAYFYSTTKNKQEFELSATVENGDLSQAILVWNYKTVSKNILPSITLATYPAINSNVEIKAWLGNGDTNRNLFVYNWQENNLVYSFDDPFEPISDWTEDFIWSLQKAISTKNFWQNSDYRNCVEISEAWKIIIPLTASQFEYQIISSNWALTNTWCIL